MSQEPGLEMEIRIYCIRWKLLLQTIEHIIQSVISTEATKIDSCLLGKYNMQTLPSVDCCM
jgi:hypothetical protein